MFLSCSTDNIYYRECNRLNFNTFYAYRSLSNIGIRVDQYFPNCALAVGLVGRSTFPEALQVESYWTWKLTCDPRNPYKLSDRYEFVMFVACRGWKATIIKVSEDWLQRYFFMSCVIKAQLWRLFFAHTFCFVAYSFKNLIIWNRVFNEK